MRRGEVSSSVGSGRGAVDQVLSPAPERADIQRDHDRRRGGEGSDHRERDAVLSQILALIVDNEAGDGPSHFLFLPAKPSAYGRGNSLRQSNLCADFWPRVTGTPQCNLARSSTHATKRSPSNALSLQSRGRRSPPESHTGSRAHEPLTRPLPWAGEAQVEDRSPSAQRPRSRSAQSASRA